MILVDTSIWVDHLRRGDATLVRLLTNSQVLGHPAITGELGLGSLANRVEVLNLLSNLPPAVRATHDEVMDFVHAHQLMGLGIGYVDVHLLASTALSGHTSLWTRDKRLRGASLRLGISAPHN
ncbi:MAG: type II toxin-antitoxin system VapC family toxin [Actinobacteria bacterium]|nr:type II toxin-antitoxin system VapC family toxin [Actinomycetota bacterium]